MKNKLADNQPRNPLLLPILEILLKTTHTLSEHELINQLKQPLQSITKIAHSQQLVLFQTHFLVMNALYQLQSSLCKEGYYLSISPLAIKLQSTSSETQTLLTAGSNKELADYYLKWSHFEQTNEQDVDSLLSSFWQRYVADDEQQQAYSALNLATDASWAAIQKNYRQLAAEKHPDRGGNSAEFLIIREAYETLRRLHQS